MNTISSNALSLSTSSKPFAFDNPLLTKNGFSSIFEEEEAIMQREIDQLVSKLECSYSYIDSYDPTWFRFADTHKAANIAESLSFVKKLGKGVYGDVYLCSLRNDPSKKFAVKRVRQAPFPYDSIFGIEQNTIKELHALRSLKRPHANIVRLYDYCSAIENCSPTNSKQNGSRQDTCIIFYLIFELCDMDLSQFVKENAEKYKPHHTDLITSALTHTDANDVKAKDLIDHSEKMYVRDKVNHNTNVIGKIPLPALEEDLAKVIMYQLLQGLAYLHSNRIIHRDIKPQNILLKRSYEDFETFTTTKSPQKWQVKIADLGLSTIVPARYVSSMTEEVVTLLYRPPELLLGDCKYTTSVDIWSTAVTVAECLLGKPIFRGRSEFSVLMRIMATIGCPPMTEVEKMSMRLKYLTDEIPTVTRDPYDSLRKVFTDNFGRQLLSETGIDLFVKMLKFLPHERLTAKEALCHPWFWNINELLKPSVVRLYKSAETIFPKGYNDLMPLTYRGDVDEYRKNIRKRLINKRFTIDSYVTQFTFP